MRGLINKGGGLKSHITGNNEREKGEGGRGGLKYHRYDISGKWVRVFRKK